MSGAAPQKTNVVRILESMGISFDLATYPVGEEHVDAVSVARELGVPADVVWKTLVARDEKERALVFCVPGNLELDQKKAAKAAGVRSVRLIPLKELQPLTGYVRGGCSPIGMKKKLPTWLEEIGTTYERIYVNAGARGIQVIISPADLARVADAMWADLV
jgi:Cys-tRNA(Pro)/Cys-tRNA(Cys) deacylase